MKKILITMLVLACAIGFAAEIKVITIAAGSTSGTYVNNEGLPRVYKLGSAFGTLTSAGTSADTNSVSVTHLSVVYTVDTGVLNTAKTAFSVDFADEAYVGWGDTITVTRTANSTNTAQNVMIVLE